MPICPLCLWGLIWVLKKVIDIKVLRFSYWHLVSTSVNIFHFCLVSVTIQGWVRTKVEVFLTYCLVTQERLLWKTQIFSLVFKDSKEHFTWQRGQWHSFWELEIQKAWEYIKTQNSRCWRATSSSICWFLPSCLEKQMGWDPETTL